MFLKQLFKKIANPDKVENNTLVASSKYIGFCIITNFVLIGLLYLLMYLILIFVLKDSNIWNQSNHHTFTGKLLGGLFEGIAIIYMLFLGLGSIFLFVNISLFLWGITQYANAKAENLTEKSFGYLFGVIGFYGAPFLFLLLSPIISSIDNKISTSQENKKILQNSILRDKNSKINNFTELNVPLNSNEQITKIIYHHKDLYILTEENVYIYSNKIISSVPTKNKFVFFDINSINNQIWLSSDKGLVEIKNNKFNLIPYPKDAFFKINSTEKRTIGMDNSTNVYVMVETNKIGQWNGRKWKKYEIGFQNDFEFTWGYFPLMGMIIGNSKNECWLIKNGEVEKIQDLQNLSNTTIDNHTIWGLHNSYLQVNEKPSIIKYSLLSKKADTLYVDKLNEKGFENASLIIQNKINSDTRYLLFAINDGLTASSIQFYYATFKNDKQLNYYKINKSVLSIEQFVKTPLQTAFLSKNKVFVSNE